MSNKSSGKSEGAGDDVERPDAESEDAEKAPGRSASSKDDDDEDEEETVDDPVPAAKQDDEDDEDDEDEPKAVAKAAPAKKAASSSSKRSASRVADAEAGLAAPSEAEIDSPSKQTLGMLGVVAAATLVMWGVGRAECNYNEVGEGMKPREVNLEERTRTPKDLAFAFEYALARLDFATARKLSTGDAKKLVEQREQACKGAACDEKRKLLEPKVNSVSELLKRTSSHGLVRVWSEGGDNGQKHLAILKREGRGWLVESYRPDTGASVELPGDAPAVPPTDSPATPAPTGSAPPSGAASAMPPGHPPMPPGYPVNPHLGAQSPERATPAPAAGAHRPAPGVTKPAPAPGAAKPPAAPAAPAPAAPAPAAP